ncbi:DUF3499 domain-containing protein [Paenarthrobacter sp. Z7-10]|uniref:DUF3499 domain-containing protein n=1 Tax=Paenarthrobacter sp. Z7-10 TaxID=2787635 RepID=UPI0022A99442|nr:DUF3499 domain-containing protein [Paenarthrobacter sp. Z7-10]MCZ2403254.1 DUF3499 domain-containing protein [Paenarthrobacter sp. Z7-10]
MGNMRQCSRSACRESAVATLTYVYSDSTAVLGPLATFAEPHCYDLCPLHAGRLTVPRGWEVVRLTLPALAPAADPDDLLALADAVREGVSVPPDDGPLTQRGVRSSLEPPAGAAASQGMRRGHLRILRD